MPERRKGRVTRATKTSVQTSLRDHFQKNLCSDEHEDSVTRIDALVQNSPEVVHINLDSSDDDSPELRADSVAQTSEPRPKRLVWTLTKQGHSSNKLFPIFTRSYREKPPEIIDVDGEEAITASEYGTSEAEPPPLSSQTSPRSDFTPSSRQPSPLPTSLTSDARPTIIGPDIACMDKDAELPAPMRKLAPQTRTLWGSYDAVPFPNGESQHVRGSQCSYSASQSPLQNKSYSRSQTRCDDCSLDFLSRQPLRDVTQEGSTSQLRTLYDRFSSKPYENHLQASNIVGHSTTPPPLSNFSESNTSTDMWVHRFRPKRAEEVLGNEQHALFLRNWLHALELQLQDKQTGDAEPLRSQGTSNKQTGKCDITASQPRGGKRPRVIREVLKTRGRKKRRLGSDDELDDFIVFSDGDDEGVPDDVVFGETEDESAFYQQTLSSIRGAEAPPSQRNATIAEPEQLPVNGRTLCDLNRQHKSHEFADALTNTLLIVGPPGCGKTAAVYACAEELGWDVFEVYPGIGRRSATNLDYLVGDVGKNHILSLSQERSAKRSMKVVHEAPPTLAALFAKGRMGKSKPGPKVAKRGSDRISTDIEDDHCSDTTDVMAIPPENIRTDTEPHSPKPTTGGLKPAVRQSLVLLEEVDILFKDDTSFWPAVVNLIRDCKRPVVMTCNDLRLVPLAILPLQTVLVFEPCPSTVAVSYLESLTLTEGWLIPREHLMALYETTHTIEGIDMPESPLCPRTEPLPCPDLRRTITQLQMLYSSAARGSASDMLQGTREAGGHVRRSGRTISAESNATRLPSTEYQRWRRMSQHADLLSFVNSNLCRSPLRTPEALSFAVSEPTLDEELGHSPLFMDAHVLDTRQDLVFYHHDELIAQEAIRLSRGIHEELATDPTATSINPAASLTREETEIFRSRVAYQSQITGALQDIIQPPAPLMPQSSVFLDYIPWVRYMVMVDDNLERMAQETKNRGKSGRITRNSMKTKHIRNIDLDERQQGMLFRTRLGGEYQGTFE
ncbi:hypothetical protein V8B97DRAFT_1862947 [Scleroderma yunnanense]